jgi:DNA-binding response OmpR family regulator
LLDYLLGEDDGLKLAIEFHAQSATTQIIMMTGGGLSGDEHSLCEKYEFPILYKPFLTEDVLRFLRGRINTSAVSNVSDLQASETTVARI